MKEFKIRINSRDDFEKVLIKSTELGYERSPLTYAEFVFSLHPMPSGNVEWNHHPKIFRDSGGQDISVSDFLNLTKKDTQSEPVGANNPAGERS